MRPLYVLYALITALCWGANFVAAKIGMEHFPPLLLLTLRFALVAAILLPFYWRRTIPFHVLLPMSLILGTAHFALMFTGIAKGLDLATAIITAQLGVPFSCLLSAMLFDDRLGPWRSFGMVVAFIGIMFIAGTPQVVANFYPFLMVMGASFCWASGNILLKRQGTANVLEMLAWLSLLVVPQMLLLSLLIESNHWELLITAPASAVIAVLFTAVASTVVAYGLWYHLLQNCEVSRVTPFNLLVPIFGIAIAQIFYQDPLSMKVLIGGAITLGGVAIIVFRKPRLSVLGKIRRKSQT